MYPGGGYTAEVTCLSPKATEKDVYDFFIHCGMIEHLEITRSGECARTAYVTFRDFYALETAVLLSGATIVDQRVCISGWGIYADESDPWRNSPWNYENNSMATTPGEAVTVAQEVVTVMIAKGYVLGKDALIKAKAFDEAHGVSAAAAAKILELSKRIGLTDKIHAGMEAVRSVDQQYHVSEYSKSAAHKIYAGVEAARAVEDRYQLMEFTKSAAVATGKTTVAAANALVNSSYFAKGALWVSRVLTRAAKAAADMGNNSNKM